jgi:hypothetical protein
MPARVRVGRGFFPSGELSLNQVMNAAISFHILL